MILPTDARRRAFIAAAVVMSFAGSRSSAVGAVAGASSPATVATRQGPSQDPADLRYEYASEAEALAEMFPAGERFELQLVRVDEQTRAALESGLDRRLPDAPLRTYLVYGAAESFKGYAVVAEEVGKYRPITFMVGVEPDFRVREVQILVYRESRGMEVRHRRFLRQYDGKKADDRLRVGRDIVNITGATLSVRAMNAGVKRVLATLESVFGRARGSGDGPAAMPAGQLRPGGRS